MPGRDETIYAVGRSLEGATAIYRVAPGAPTAERLPTPPFETVRVLAESPDGSRLRVVDAHCAIFESDDAGWSWRSVGGSPGARLVPVAGIDPADPDHIACPERGDVVGVTFDGGRTWEAAALPPLAPHQQALALGWAFSPVDGRIVWLLRRLEIGLFELSYQLLYSEDGGRTFRQEFATNSTLVEGVVADRVDVNRVVFASETGVHWYDRNLGNRYVSSDALFRATPTSNGMEWRTIRSFDTSPVDGSVYVGLTHSTICEDPCRMAAAHP